MAVGDIPEDVVDAIRLGQLTALAKPDGGVKGIVVGDIVRRLVARTMVKQVAKKADKATAPFHCALSIKSRMRVRRTQGAGTHRPRRQRQGVRCDLQERNVRRPLEDGRRRSDPPVCAVVCGKMRWGNFKKSRREREGSRANPSCQCCSLWKSTQPWRPSGGAFQRRKVARSP